MAPAAAAALVGAAVQSATGFGFALILSPALFAGSSRTGGDGAARPRPGLNLLVLFDGGALGPVNWRELLPVLGAALPGLALGAAALELLAKPVLQVFVGVVLLVAASLQLPGRLTGRRARTRSATAAGLASGALTTSISISGPPLVLWLESRGIAPPALALNLAGCALLVPLAGIDRVAPAGVLLPLLASS